MPPNPPKKPKKTSRAVFSPQMTRQVLDFFAFNNYQDFNTWQQIARSKMDISYNEADSQCKLVLSFDDPEVPTFNVLGLGKTKKESKKNALQKLILQIVQQGYVYLGFKDQNYMQKLQQKRKDISLVREQETAFDVEERLKRGETLTGLLRCNKEAEAIEFLCKDLFSAKSLDSRQVSIIWLHLLQNNDTALMETFLAKIHGDCPPPKTTSELKGKDTSNLLLDSRYGFKRISVSNSYQQYDIDRMRRHTPIECPTSPYEQVPTKDPSQYHLDDLIKPFELELPKHAQSIVEFDQKLIKKKRKLEIVADPVPIPLTIPTYSNNLLIPEGVNLSKIETGAKLPMFPPPLVPIMGIHPLMAVEVMKQRNKLAKRHESFLVIPPFAKFNTPSFEGSSIVLDRSISIKCLEALYDGLFFLSDLKRALRLSQLVYSLCWVQLGDQECRDYYLNRKNQLVCEFLQDLAMSRAHKLVSIEGQAVKVLNKNREQVIHFTPKQQFMEMKVNKKNTNEFEEMYQMSKGEYVQIRLHGEEQTYIGYMREVNPIIISCPWIKLHEVSSCCLTKITNRRVYEKISQALINVSQDMALFKSQNIQLFWQLPGTSRSFFLETVLEWNMKEYHVLITSPNIDQISLDLTLFGVKHMKLTPKVDQKHVNIINPKIVVASINSCCNDALKSLSFTHVIVDQANQLSEVVTLLAISKGCTQLVMIGDFQKTEPMARSFMAVSKGISVSLYQRLANKETPVLCYNTQRKIHKSISDYVSAKFYGNLLQTQESGFVVPTVKGFNWPSEDSRMCLINVKGRWEAGISLIEAEIIIKILFDVLKAGYSSISDIEIVVATEPQRILLTKLTERVLKRFPSSNTQDKPTTAHQVCSTFNGNQNVEKELVIMGGCQQGAELSDPKKLNWALSRARRGFVLVGNLANLGKMQHFSQLIRYCNTRNLLRRI